MCELMNLPPTPNVSSASDELSRRDGFMLIVLYINVDARCDNLATVVGRSTMRRPTCHGEIFLSPHSIGSSIAEWLACWTRLRNDLYCVGWGVKLYSNQKVSMLDSGAEGPKFKSQPRRCRVTVISKLYTPIVPLFTKQRNW